MPIVLVIEQGTARRPSLAQMLHDLEPHLEVESFDAPEAALRWLGWHAADLVIADTGLDADTAVGFLQQVRALPRGDHLPVVIVTPADDRDLRCAVLEAGASDILADPVDPLECRVRCRNLLTQHRQHRIIRDRARWLEKQVSDAVAAVRVREQETLLRLAKAGEYRDEETGNHVIRMAKYARLIAEELGLPSDECDVIELAAPMHDIGKIGIPDRILRTPGRLTPEDFEIMQRHTLIGYEILKDSPSQYLQTGAIIALGHHERMDGRGYPHGLQGSDIPLPARIVAVADVYDALTSARVYKAPWTLERALAFMDGERGTHFDPDCLDAFLARIDRVQRIQRVLGDDAGQGLPQLGQDSA